MYSESVINGATKMQNHKKKVRIIIGITAGIWFLSLAVFLVAGRIDPVEYVGVSQQRNGNVRNRNHPLCGCATLVIQKTPFHYNRGVQATI